MNRDLTREEVFLLVWGRPTQDVARELGISGVALGRLCKKLQIPKPPPGYWAKVKAGKRDKKPILKEFSESLIDRQKARARQRQVKRGSFGLSSLQGEVFQRAVDELSAAGVDLGEMEVTKSGVRLIDGDTATQILLLIQKRYVKWLMERSNSEQIPHSAIRSVQALVSKLLPFAKAHVLLLKKKPEKHKPGDQGPKVIIRITPEFIQQVANLRRVVAENGLSHVVWSLGPFEHAWIVQYHYQSERYTTARSQLCVSSDAMWVICRATHFCDEHLEETLETSEIPLRDIAPIQLVTKDDIALPAVLELPKLGVSRRRIEAFVEVDRAYKILSSAVYKYDYPMPDDHLVLLEKIYLGGETNGPLTVARETCRKLEEYMERWEVAMEAERTVICGEALGLKIGDTVISESGGKLTRIKIEQMSAYVHGGKLNFHISGKRYRRDGILGKRVESVYLCTGSELASA